MRKRREKIPLPSCALVGYTNAGKSSLLNSLTGSGVFVEDKLFATLDPTTRRLSLSGSTSILLTDTVGFIRNLPHTLIDAFKSTLEEAVRADLLLIVLDASDTDVFGQYETVCTVLEEIGASKNKRLLILNKTDKEECERNFSLSRIKETGQNALEVSAKNSAGFDALIEAIADSLFGTIKEYSLKLSDTELLNEIRKNGILVSSEWTEDAVKIKARISEVLETKLFAPPSKPLLP
jgi:GTP-binding protein HflX